MEVHLARVRLISNLLAAALAAAEAVDIDEYGEAYDKLIEFEKKTGEYDEFEDLDEDEETWTP